MLVAPRIPECFDLPWSAFVCYSLPWSTIVCLECCRFIFCWLGCCWLGPPAMQEGQEGPFDFVLCALQPLRPVRLPAPPASPFFVCFFVLFFNFLFVFRCYCLFVCLVCWLVCLFVCLFCLFV